MKPVLHRHGATAMSRIQSGSITNQLTLKPSRPLSDDHPAAARPKAEIERPRHALARVAGPESARRPVPDPEGNPADNGSDDEARRSEHTRDNHGEDLGAPCRAAVALSRGVRVQAVRGVGLRKLVVAYRGSASLAPHELDHGLNRDAIPKDLCGAAIHIRGEVDNHGCAARPKGDRHAARLAGLRVSEVHGVVRVELERRSHLQHRVAVAALHHHAQQPLLGRGGALLAELAPLALPAGVRLEALTR
eukprot:scaffold12088_cov55-Phaeocystis_antarctica.AAC.2